MTVINGYCTLADYKAYVTARGQTTSTDDADDGVISNLINAASRFLDTATNRRFYPYIENHLFDIPPDRQLFLDDDLLEVITLTNGDDVEIDSTNYILKSNRPPHWCISLRDTSTVYWAANSNGSSEQVISLNGTWGYHDNFSQRAWSRVDTISAAITDTSTLTFTTTGNNTLVAGNIVKIGSEIMNISVASGHNITSLKRGDNGSTAATHLINSYVYAWQPMEGAKQSCLEIVNSAYHKRFGRNTGESATVTAAGVVLTPQDITGTAKTFIKQMQRYAWQ